MGPDLILAAIVATMITRAWEHSKRRACTEWSQARHRARQRAEQRQQRRDQRAQRRGERVTKARSTGPRDPLWWPYATGWLVAASMRASYAAVQGAREGGAAGAREGYRIGRERARARRERRERAAYLNGQRSTRNGAARDCAGSREGDGDQPRPPASEGADEVAMDSCTGCGVYVTADALDAAGRCRVCAGPDSNSPDGPAARADSDPPGSAAGPADNHDNGNDNNGKDDEPVTELAPTNGSAGTGEGYTETVSTLHTLAAQLKAAHETAQALQENLTANEVDAVTITNVGELMDSLDAAAPLAQQTAAHVVTRHEPVAEAHAAAGGSQNVAAKTWYDDH